MKFEYLNPDFDPRNQVPLGQPQPHHFSSGTAYERHKNFVEGVIRGLRLKPEQVSDLERLMAQMYSRMKTVRAYAEEIDKNVKSMGADHNRKQLAEEVQNQLLNGFVDFTKDQLLTMLTVHLTQLITEEIV